MFQCSVVSSQEGNQPVIPDHGLLYLTCESGDEAHFMAGLLNSAPARLALWCSSVGVQTQRYFPTDVSRVRLPEFRDSNKTHAAVVRLAEECHRLAGEDNRDGLTAVEEELNEAVAGIWGITPKELEQVLKAYQETKGYRSARVKDEEVDGEEDGAEEEEA